jgi:hypothetical protein
MIPKSLQTFRTKDHAQNHRASAVERSPRRTRRRRTERAAMQAERIPLKAAFMVMIRKKGCAEAPQLHSRTLPDAEGITSLSSSAA